MAPRIEEDFDAPDGGQAVLTVSGVGSGAISLAITRLKGEPNHLGPAGWQTSATNLKPDAVRTTGGETELVLGPGVCDHLAEYMEIDLTIPALGVRERLVWPYITPRPEPMRRAAAVERGTDSAEVEAELAPQKQTPVHVPQPDPKPDQDPKPTEKDRTNLDGDPERKPPSKWSTSVPILLILAILAVVTVAMYLQREPEATPTTDELMDEAQACLRDDCPAETFLDIGQRLEAIGALDQALRVMSLAADRGVVEAQLWLAARFDPIHFEPGRGVSAPDPVTAAVYYTAAVGAGAEDAAVAVERMCEALKDPDADIAVTDAPSREKFLRESCP